MFTVTRCPCARTRSTDRRSCANDPRRRVAERQRRALARVGLRQQVRPREAQRRRQRDAPQPLVARPEQAQVLEAEPRRLAVGRVAADAVHALTEAVVGDQVRRVPVAGLAERRPAPRQRLRQKRSGPIQRLASSSPSSRASVHRSVASLSSQSTTAA